MSRWMGACRVMRATVAASLGCLVPTMQKRRPPMGQRVEEVVKSYEMEPALELHT